MIHLAEAIVGVNKKPQQIGREKTLNELKRDDTLYFLSQLDNADKIYEKHFDRFSKRKNGDVWVYLRLTPTVCVKVYEFNQDALTLPAAVTYAGNFIGTSEKAVLELKEKLKR